MADDPQQPNPDDRSDDPNDQADQADQDANAETPPDSPEASGDSAAGGAELPDEGADILAGLGMSGGEEGGDSGAADASPAADAEADAILAGLGMSDDKDKEAGGDDAIADADAILVGLGMADAAGADADGGDDAASGGAADLLSELEAALADTAVESVDTAAVDTASIVDAAMTGDATPNPEPVSAGPQVGDAVSLPDFGAPTPPETPEPAGMSLLNDVELRVQIELGRTRMYVEDVLRLTPESVIELDKAAGDPVDIYVNQRHVARGEVLVLNENFCVRISEIIHDPVAPDA